MLPADLVPSVLDSAPDAMLVIDRDGLIIYANRQITALFGYERPQVLGQPIESLLPERLRSRHIAHRQSYIESARVRPMGMGLNLWARRRDGSEFPVEISLSPIAGGDRLLIAAAIRDVTDRRQAQHELQRARETADTANLAKSRFLATASHDLRQPLQTLSLLNGAMRRSGASSQIAEALAQQQQAIDAMSKLLNGLLDISKLESGAIRPEMTDFKVATIFHELREEFAQLAHSKGLSLQVETCDDCVRSDPSLVGQVLRNLLANAIKYTRQGWVLLRCLHEPGLVRLEVLDTGIGIARQDLGHIFEEFYQVGVPAHASREGYGLGLSIVRRIVDLLGVPIDVRSEPGRGTAFSLALPQGAAAASGAASSASSVASVTGSHPGGRQRLLLIEDDPAVRQATRLLLRSAGYEPIVAASVAEAVEFARTEPEIALMITDFHLTADETGPDAIRAVRAALGRPVKAILVTGDTSSAVQGAIHDEVVAIASKPINAEVFLDLLSGLLRQ